MRQDLIRRDLVHLDLEVADQSEFFDRIVGRLEQLGYVRPSFREAIQAREQKYPTGLPTEPEAIAIPHSDVEHVLRPFIAPVRLLAPIAWHEMGNDENVHEVRFIFMLGFTGGDGHVEVLQILLDNFMDEDFLRGLVAAKTEDEYFDHVRAMRGLDS